MRRYYVNLLIYAGVATATLVLLLPLGWLFIWLGGSAGLAIFTCLICLGLAVGMVTTVFGILFGAPYVPVTPERLQAMMILSRLKAGERLVDLGSGDGCILIEAAGRGAVATGWEINPYLCAWTWLAARTRGLGGRVTVHCSSYWDDSYGFADVVALYLLPSQMARLEKKLLKELRPGARVVSAGFTFPNWKPVEEAQGVRLYVVPPKV